jgi:hypothetical protein
MVGSKKQDLGPKITITQRKLFYFVGLLLMKVGQKVPDQKFKVNFLCQESSGFF